MLVVPFRTYLPTVVAGGAAAIIRPEVWRESPAIRPRVMRVVVQNRPVILHVNLLLTVTPGPPPRGGSHLLPRGDSRLLPRGDSHLLPRPAPTPARLRGFPRASPGRPARGSRGLHLLLLPAPRGNHRWVVTANHSPSFTLNVHDLFALRLNYACIFLDIFIKSFYTS